MYMCVCVCLFINFVKYVFLLARRTTVKYKVLIDSKSLLSDHTTSINYITNGIRNL